MHAEHTKRGISLLLAFVMVFTILPVQVFSVESDTDILGVETEDGTENADYTDDVPVQTRAEETEPFGETDSAEQIQEEEDTSEQQPMEQPLGDSAFDYALLDADYTYLTENASVRLRAIGVSNHGTEEAIPEGSLTWSVLDNTVGTVDDSGLFTAAALGDTEVFVSLDGRKIGSIMLYVVQPDTLLFTDSSIKACIGETTMLPLAAQYDGKNVAISEEDVNFTVSDNGAGICGGSVTGFMFTGNESSGLETVTISAALAENAGVNATLSVTMYTNSEEAADLSVTPGNGSYIGFTADMHDRTDHLTNWLIGVQNDLEPDLEYMVFGGDFTYNKSITSFDKAVSIVNQTVGQNRGVYTTGNHEYDNSSVAQQMAGTAGFKRIGLAVDAVNYDIYCIGAAGTGSETFGTFGEDDRNTLEAYLMTAPKDEPIFLVAHWPLHDYGNRTTTGASEMIDLLNQYPNVVFLWGHNHSQNDPHYGEILTDGDSIKYKNGRYKEIEFTYVSAGAMRGDRPPYYGLVANVSTGGDTVTLTYYDADGKMTNVTETVKIGDGAVAPDPNRPGSVVVTGVSLNVTNAVMAAGDQQTLTATVMPSNATNKAVTWSSDNPSVATVAGGVVTAKTPGTASITVTTEDGGKTEICTVTVLPATIAATGVFLNKTSTVLTVGDKVTLTATVSPSNATNKAVAWRSSDPSVAVVSDGIVTARAAGTAAITATTADSRKTATCTVTVNPAAVAVTGVSLNKTNLILTVGGSNVLTADVAPSNAANRTVSWTSSNPAVVTADNGVVRAVSNGRAVITVATQDGNFNAVCNVVVNRAENAHRHQPEFARKREATCFETGMEAHWFCDGCDCFFLDERCTSQMDPEDLIIGLTDHSRRVLPGTPVTCTDDGLTDGVVCSVCGRILTEQLLLDALGHIEVTDEPVASTCTETGLTEGSHCSVCGEVLVAQEEIPAHGHNFVQENRSYVCACGFEMYLRLQQQHVSLYRNQRYRLQAEVSSRNLSDDIQWTLEEGGEEVLSVDARGNIRTLGIGTAYVVVSVTDNDITLTERCRIDVSESIELDGIQLSTRKLASELYSTDYASFDILLQLPQNYPTDQGTLSVSQNAALDLEDSGIAVDSAEFADETMEKLFELVVLDDRRVQVVPTDYAVANPGEVKSKYTGSVIVTVQGKRYTSEAMTLSIRKSTPKLKAAVAAFNSFYSGTSQEIIITGGTPTRITANGIPQWLTLKDGILTLSNNAPLKNISDKANILVETEEWRIPAAITMSVKNSYRAPGLKLSASSVTMTTLTANSGGVELKLLPKSAKDTLKTLNVTGITAPKGYSIENFSQEDGTFILKAEGRLKSGKITLNVSFSDTKVKVPLALTVKAAEVTLKPAVKSLTMNTALQDTAAVAVTATPGDYRITEPNFRLTDTKGADKTGELEIGFEDGNVLVSTTDATPTGASYKLYISAGGSKEAVVTIKTVSGKPSVTFKAKSYVDLTFPDQAAQVTPTFKNYNGAFTIVGMTAQTSGKQDATGKFRTEVDGKSILVRCADNTAAGTYTLKLKLSLVDGSICENTVKVTVKRTPVKLKLSATKLSLNKSINGSASVSVTCMTKGYTFAEPVWELSAPGKLDIRYSDGALKVATNAATQYGATYRILVKANAAAPAAALTVTIPPQNKSNVTVSLKASGKLDVIRSDKGVIVTPAYKNVTADTERLESLVFYSSADNYTKPVNGLFQYESNGKGGYLISRAEGAKLDHNLKYKAALVSIIGGTEVRSSKVSLKVTMGSARLTVQEGSVDLFAKDKNDRATFHLIAKDGALNAAERVQIKDAKYQDLFEVYTYGNGEFAIGFKNGKVSRSLIGKSVTVTLNAWVEGNQTVKANTKIKLKLNIVQ